MIKCLDKGSDIIDNPDLAKKVDLPQIECYRQPSKKA